MTTRAQLAIDNLNFLNGGTEIFKVTATIDGQATFSSNAGSVLLKNVTDPTDNQDVATKNYVDSIATAGASWKNSAAAATTEDGTLATAFAAGQVIDGVTLEAGDRVLIKDQTSGNAGVDNGLYVVQASGAPVRSPDMPVGSFAAGSAVWINEGTVHGDRGYICTNNHDPDALPSGYLDEVGTDPLVFTNFSSAPAVAGSDTQVQFNNNGYFGADGGFTYTKSLATGGELELYNTSSNADAIKISDGSTHIMNDLYLDFGNSRDFRMRWDSSNAEGRLQASGALRLANQQETAPIYFEVGTTAGSGDIRFVKGDGTSQIMTVDNNGLVEMQANSEFKLLDTVNLTVGTGNDLRLVHDGTDSSVTNTTGILSMTNNGTGDLSFANTAGGNIVIDNQFATGNVDISLASDGATAEAFNVTNDSGTAFLTIGSDGANTIKHNSNDGTVITSFVNSDDTRLLSVGGLTANSGKNVNISNGAWLTLSDSEGQLDSGIYNDGSNTYFSTFGSGNSTIFRIPNSPGDGTTSYKFQNNSAQDMFTMNNNDTMDMTLNGETYKGSFNVRTSADGHLTPIELFSVEALTATTGVVTFSTGVDAKFVDDVELQMGDAGTEFVMVHTSGGDHTLTNNEGNMSVVQNDSTNNGEQLILENTGTGATSENSIVLKTGSTDSNTSVLVKNSADTTLLRIDGGGENSTSTTTGAVQITGGLGVTQDVYAQSFNASSDATLKTNIKSLENPLETLEKIEGYSYNWIKGYGSNERVQWGVLAQQLEEVGLGHMVGEGDIKSVNYLMFIPLLIESMKEMKQKINILES